MNKRAILLLNMGGATTRDEFRLFLTNMFDDPNILGIHPRWLRRIIARYIIRSRLDIAWQHYEQIGGSPLPQLTDYLIDRMRGSADAMILPMMCYTHPNAEDVIAKLRNNDIDEIILLPLYPQYSTTTTLSSVEAFVHAGGSEWKYRIIDPYYANSRFNMLIVEHILSIFGEKKFSDFVLIFSAHGLPQKIVDRGDPYQQQMEEQVNILTHMFRDRGIFWQDICLGYQSRVGKMPWIGPSMETVLGEQSGKNVIVFPLSFIIDNTETVYELGIELRRFAISQGVHEYILCSCVGSHENAGDVLLSLIGGEKGNQ